MPLSLCFPRQTLSTARVLCPASMSNTQHATERTPLIKSDDPRDSRQDQGPNEPVEADESQQQIPDREGEEPFKSTTNVTYILLILSIGAFLALLDQSVVAAISGDIGSDLGALRSVSWIATAYFLSMTCSQPLYGKLSDVFGRKPCLLFAYTMFGIGSLGCGLTGTMGGLIAARVSYCPLDRALTMERLITEAGYSGHWRWWRLDCSHGAPFRPRFNQRPRYLSRLS